MVKAHDAYAVRSGDGGKAGGVIEAIRRLVHSCCDDARAESRLDELPFSDGIWMLPFRIQVRFGPSRPPEDANDADARRRSIERERVVRWIVGCPPALSMPWIDARR